MAKSELRRQKEAFRKMRREVSLYAKLAAPVASPSKTPASQASAPQPGGRTIRADWRQRMNEIATNQGEWAGSPTPVFGPALVLEKRYPYNLNGWTLDGPPKAPAPPVKDYVEVNSWFCSKHHAMVYVVREVATGKSHHFMQPQYGGVNLNMWIDTMVAAEAWTVEAELRALSKLKEMIPDHLYRAYFLTGTFLETSKRTNLVYVFRRLRPTVVLRGYGDEPMRIQTILCLHPLGYYNGSWAGVMCPTDDVIAHLLLMRGDEAFLWRKANHHPSWSAQAGI